MILKERLRHDLDQIQQRAQAIAEKDDQSDADKKNLADLLAEGQEIQQRAESLNAIDSLRATGSGLGNVQNREEHQDVEDGSWGERFTRAEQFTDYRMRGTSARVTVDMLQTRALPMTLTGSANAISKQKIITEEPEPPAPLLALIPTVTVSSNGFDVITWAKTAGGAAVVAEGSAKPSAEWAPSSSPITLDTVAVHTQLTRQLMEDEPAVRSKVDTELRREVLRKLEADSAAALVAATLPTAIDATNLTNAIRKGAGVVMGYGYQPNAVLLNPADWAALDIQVFGSTLLGPSMGSQYWGLRPVSSVAQPAGTATVGDFRSGAERYARSGVSLYVTDSHASTFLSNVFTILAETRSKTVVTHPNAFCECSKSP